MISVPAGGFDWKTMKQNKFFLPLVFVPVRLSLDYKSLTHKVGCGWRMMG
jgi:hypothetical protein